MIRLLAALMVVVPLFVGCDNSCNDNDDPTDPNSCAFGAPEPTSSPVLEGKAISTRLVVEKRGVYEIHVRFANTSKEGLRCRTVASTRTSTAKPCSNG